MEWSTAVLIMSIFAAASFCVCFAVYKIESRKRRDIMRKAEVQRHRYAQEREAQGKIYAEADEYYRNVRPVMRMMKSSLPKDEVMSELLLLELKHPEEKWQIEIEEMKDLLERRPW